MQLGTRGLTRGCALVFVFRYLIDVVRTLLPQFSTTHFIHNLLFLTAVGIYATADACSNIGQPCSTSVNCCSIMSLEVCVEGRCAIRVE